MHKWSRTSWQAFSSHQRIDYTDADLLNQVVFELSNMPSLVKVSEILALQDAIAQAGRGETFLLQGGDCAEMFKDCRLDRVNNKLHILSKMQHILAKNIPIPIIQIGRIAGQYAKPRTSLIETIDDISLPCYRGDLINQPYFNADARNPNPSFMLKGYHCARQTLEYIQLLRDKSSEFYTSHEALHLYYEQALTRESSGDWYNLSTHLPWLGVRTAEIKSAHVEYLSGIKNPIGIKIGPTMTPSTLIELLAILNPQNTEGKILLITRLGAKTIQDYLPGLIKTVHNSGFLVTWMCDPMHGNAEYTKDRIKTRHFDNILSELNQAVTIHRQYGSILGGVHFELTGDNVTECIGGSQGISANDLQTAYESLVDPRLNGTQSEEMALLLGESLKLASLSKNS